MLPFFGVQGQPYWHWPERLAAFFPGPGAGDTTLVRRAWVFEADTQVVLFSFDVLMSAPWPPPDETRWRVEFPGDSIPDLTAEPRWRLTNDVGTVSLNDPSPGIFTVTTPDGGSFHAFVRFDTLASTSDAYMDVRVRRNAPLNAFPEISFGMDDDMKFVAVGLSETHVGFLTESFEFSGTPVPATTTEFHRYQIRKFGADSIQLRMDDERIASATYASFPATIAAFPFGFFWGGVGHGASPSSSGGNSSSWDHVIYEIGVSTP